MSLMEHQYSNSFIKIIMCLVNQWSINLFWSSLAIYLTIKTFQHDVTISVCVVIGLILNLSQKWRNCLDAKVAYYKNAQIAGKLGLQFYSLINFWSDQTAHAIKRVIFHKCSANSVRSLHLCGCAANVNYLI